MTSRSHHAPGASRDARRRAALPLPSAILRHAPTIAAACLVSLLAGAAAACGGSSPSGPSPQEPGASASSLRIVVDIYSGRENPVVTLSAADAETLERLMLALGDVRPATPDPPGSGRVLQPLMPLGYRGLLVTQPQGVASEVRRFSDTLGVIYHRDPAGTVKMRPDEGRTVERWLVSRLRDRVEPAVYDSIMQGMPR